MTSDEHRLAEGFWRAAYGEIDWEQAIDDLTRAIGNRVGQVTTIDPRLGIQSSMFSGLRPNDVADFHAAGGHLPTVNPRLAAIAAAPAGRCIVDEDFLTPGAKRDLPIFRNLFQPSGTSNVVMIRFADTQNAATFSGIAMLRDERAGAATAAERARLERIAPAVAGAVTLASRFGAFACNAMLSALASRGHAVFALGVSRRLIGLSEAAEAAIGSGHLLRMRRGCLVAADRDSDQRLADAFDAASALARGGGRAVRVALRDSRPGALPMVATLSPVPARDAPMSATVALLTIPATEHGGGADGLLADAFGLTRAEAAVALAIADGRAPSEIAASRGVSRGTIRVQLQSVLGKMGAARQSEIAAIVAALRR